MSLPQRVSLTKHRILNAENLRSSGGCGSAFLLSFFFLIVGNIATAQWLLIPMEHGKQTNHLKAYGLTYWALEVPREYRCYWWLNYRGGAFVLPDSQDVRVRAALMGVRFEPMRDADYNAIKQSVLEGSNMDEILLEKAPKIAVYAPSAASPYRDPWGRRGQNRAGLCRDSVRRKSGIRRSKAGCYRRKDTTGSTCTTRISRVNTVSFTPRFRRRSGINNGC